MALVTTLEMDGTKTIPAPNEIGKIYEHEFVVASADQNLGIGDFVQLGYKPAEAVITQVIINESVDSGATTVALGLADALVTTALASTIVAGAVIAGTNDDHIFADAPILAPGDDVGILALEVGVEAESTAVITVRIRYRAA